MGCHPSPVSAGIACALLGACALADDGTADRPRRPALDIVRDTVDPEPGQVVGRWSCHELDPFPGQAPVLTELHLEPDGRFESEERILLDGETPGPFELVLILGGSWHLEGDLLMREGVDGTSRPADGSGPAGPRPLMENVLAAMALQAETVPVELLQVRAERIVMREREPGFATLACERRST